MRRPRSGSSWSWRQRSTPGVDLAGGHGRGRSCMTERVFVDTNVWLYAVDRDEPVKQAAARAVLGALTEGRLVTSAQVIGEFYVNATLKFKPPISPERAHQ